jgi:hypothetical protein
MIEIIPAGKATVSPAHERLADLKELLQMEQNSDNPSQSYIEDLKQSIEEQERRCQNSSHG